MRATLRTYLLVIAAAAAAVGAARGAPWTVSPALLPADTPVVRDAHSAHPPGSPACAACHPRATASAWASERLAPTMAECAACHPEAKGATALSTVTDACRRCHVAFGADGAPLPGSAPRPNVRFSHRAHAAEACGDCHPAAAAGRKAEAGRDVVGMRTCYACHEGKGRALAACRTCHIAHADGRIVTEIGGALLTPPDWLKGGTHGADWRGNHAAVAGSDSEFCASCHQESWCSRCHAAKIRPRDIHPGDWLFAHGVSTRMDNPRCRSCHRSQSFCIGCHRRAGVAPDSPSNARPEGVDRFHRGESPEQICRRARYDIEACASCHSESSCITCHAAINPHPSGFAHRCKPLAQRNRRACAKCHSDNVWHRCQ
jgi:hypothetical protein